METIESFDFVGGAPTKLTFEYQPTPEVIGLPELQRWDKPRVRALLVDMLRREDEFRLAPKAAAPRSCRA